MSILRDFSWVERYKTFGCSRTTVKYPIFIHLFFKPNVICAITKRNYRFYQNSRLIVKSASSDKISLALDSGSTLSFNLAWAISSRAFPAT